MYLDVDGHVLVQFRGVDTVDLLDLYKTRPLALFGRWQGQR